MQVLQEQKPATKKSELIEALFKLSQKQIGGYELSSNQFWLESFNV